jgi:vacuolar iron transporter family protein
MENPKIDEALRSKLLAAQINELTENHIYLNLAAKIKHEGNRKILEQIANEEGVHASIWQQYTGVEAKPNRWKIFKFTLIARLLGLTFGIKLMEKGESNAYLQYKGITAIIPEAEKIAQEEDSHEQQLISLLEEEKLEYIGSVVLGLNDALVELTGSLAGFSLALQNTKLVAMAGLISGIAAGLSMAASEYLSTKSEAEHDKAFKSALYTGVAYLITVVFLILPYLIFKHYLVCLSITLLIAILIIFAFNYYISVAKDYDFKKRFLEMAFISLGVAALTFGITYIIKLSFNIAI